MECGMNDGASSEGWSETVLALIAVSIIAVSCFFCRSGISELLGAGPDGSVPGMWAMVALLVSAAALPAINLFLKSWRISSLEVLLLTVLAFALVGAFIGFVFGFVYQIDEYPLWQHAAIVMLAFGALVSLACLVLPDPDFEEEDGFCRVTDSTYPHLCSIYGRLCSKAGIQEPPPLYVGDMDSCNAFAFGKFRSRQGIIILKPMLGILDDDEIEGVLGHELSHLIHHDSAVNTVTSTCARALTAFSVVMGFAALVASAILGAGGSSSKSSNGGFAYLLIFVILLPVVIVGAVLWASVPLSMMVMAPGMSRSREFGADEGSALITGKPMALASALRKLDDVNAGRRTSLKPGVTADQMIGDPFVGTRMKLKERLMSTHPSTEERIRRLECLDERMRG